KLYKVDTSVFSAGSRWHASSLGDWRADACSADPIVAGAASNSPAYTPTSPGTYYWVASYSGDANNNSDAGSCGDAGETSVVIKEIGRASCRDRESVADADHPAMVDGPGDNSDSAS